jgi:hypothetical protein
MVVQMLKQGGKPAWDHNQHAVSRDMVLLLQSQWQIIKAVQVMKVLMGQGQTP